MSKNLQNSLDSFLENIFETKEFKKYKTAEKLWKESKDSQKLLSDFLKAKNTLEIYKQGGFLESGKEEKKIQDLYEKVKEDKNINNWVDEQNKFQEFVWKQADYISKKLGFPFSKKPSCGGGCC